MYFFTFLYIFFFKHTHPHFSLRNFAGSDVNFYADAPRMRIITSDVMLVMQCERITTRLQDSI